MPLSEFLKKQIRTKTYLQGVRVSNHTTKRMFQYIEELERHNKNLERELWRIHNLPGYTPKPLDVLTENH